MPTRDIPVKIHIEDGSLWATVESMPGVFATGETLDELRESLEEGISLYLAEQGREAPPVSVSAFGPLETSTRTSIALAC